MDLALGAMGSLLLKLGEFVTKEYRLQKGVKKKVKSFSTELKIMYTALTNVAEVPRDQLDDHVKLWATDIKELLYDMEEVVDSLLVHVEGCEPNANQDSLKKIMSKMANLFKKVKARRDISTAVKEIHTRLQDITSRSQVLNIPNLPAATRTRTTVDPFLKALYGDKKNLIGLEKARDHIINKISEGDQLKILSIVGFVGSGKTTLAKEVYDALSTKFPYKAFVSVSRNPDMKKVLTSLLLDLDKTRHATRNVNLADLNEKQLIDLIQELLSNKRYFVIIDDLWNEEAWETIKFAPNVDNKCGSIIITTTRDVSVSETCCSSQDDMIHKMEYLSEDDSKKLFYRIIFSQDVCPSRFEEVSKNILKKCGGVPLAIVSLASYLANYRNNINQWKVLLGSLGSGLTKGDNHVEQMKRILSLSYYDLPYHLKACFLYLSTFPEDHLISRDRLIRRGICEGFIQVEGETSLIELGNRYFYQLVNRSMIQPINMDVDGTVQACHVHDIMLDLICEISGEENFVTILDLIMEDTPLEDNFRRLSLQKSMTDLTTTQMATISMRKVRSFTAFCPVISKIPPLSKFQVLRVLDLEGCDLGKNPGVDLRLVEKLLHLRYLGLAGTKVGKLPMEIGKLQFLQTLNLQRTNSEEVPSSVVQLRRLVCLVLDSEMPLPKSFENLKCLEQLVGEGVGLFSVKSAEELGDLSRLRELAFKWDLSRRIHYILRPSELRSDKPLASNIEPEYSAHEALIESLANDLSTDKALIKSLGKLHNLNSLEISAATQWSTILMLDFVPPPNLRRLKFDGYFNKFPTWICSSSLPLLSYLDLNLDYKVRSEDIQIIGMLPALRYVNLLTYPSYVEKLVLSADAFPLARVCLFHKVTLVHPTFQPGAMPMVQRLRFGLQVDDILSPDFDLSIRNLPSLQQLRIDLLNNESKPEAYSKAVDALRGVVDDHSGSLTLRADKFVQY